MALDILSRLNSIKVINGTAVRTFLNISNANFKHLTEAFRDFLSNIGYTESTNSIDVSAIDVANLTLSQKLNFLVNGESVFSVDALGRVRGKYVTISDIVEMKRARLLEYPNYPAVGIEGEVIYTGLDFLGYIEGTGWVSLTSGEGGGGTPDPTVLLYKGLVNTIASDPSGIDTNDNEGRTLIDWNSVATGDFAGHEGELAIYESGWEFTGPELGFAVSVRDESSSIYVCIDNGPIEWDISGYFYETISGGTHYVMHRHPTGETAIVSSVIL